jgi:hypothetical protein
VVLKAKKKYQSIFFFQCFNHSLLVILGSNLIEPSGDLTSLKDSFRCSIGTDTQSFG